MSLPSSLLLNSKAIAPAAAARPSNKGRNPSPPPEATATGAAIGTDSTTGGSASTKGKTQPGAWPCVAADDPAIADAQRAVLDAVPLSALNATHGLNTDATG